MLIIIRSFCFACSALCFAKTGFVTSKILIGTGVIGVPFFCLLLLANENFRLENHFKNIELYLYALNALALRSLGAEINWIALKLILPSDHSMVFVFFALFTSVILQSIENRKLPLILTLISICSGIVGTAFICRTDHLFRHQSLQFNQTLGVALAAKASFILACMFSLIRKFSSITPAWSCLWQVLGIMAIVLVSYFWNMDQNWDCYFSALMFALGAISFQILASCFAFHGCFVQL